MYLSRITLENFRNYEHCSLEFAAQGGLFFGVNGSGKTNLLEAIYFLCTIRSQRLASREEMIRFEADCGFLEGVFDDGDCGERCEASVGFSRDKKIRLSVDKVALSSFSQWLGKAAVIAFGPDDIALVRGNPKDRRSFLDLLLCQIDPAYLEQLMTYKKNCAQRNILLSTKPDETALDIYEQNMARSGAIVFFKRQEIIRFIQPHFTAVYKEISGADENVSILYKPSIRCEMSTQNEWEKVFYSTLKNCRKRDALSGFTSVGPHRDDLLMLAGAKPAKLFASQGQCATLALALRICSILCCEAYKKETMLFLIDDALTFLDGGRTARVFPLIQSKGQVFVAASKQTDAAWGVLPRFNVDRGRVFSA